LLNKIIAGSEAQTGYEAQIVDGDNNLVLGFESGQKTQARIS